MNILGGVGRCGTPYHTDKIVQFTGQLNLFSGKNDIKVSCHICIPVPIMALTNFSSAHWR